jgi:hypothetical protein
MTKLHNGDIFGAKDVQRSSQNAGELQTELNARIL